MAPQYDALNVTGTATLGGNLVVATIGDYDPPYLLSHRITTAGTISHTFESVSGYALSANKSLAVIYHPGSVTVAGAIPGDANLDGKVDVTDLGALATNWQAGVGNPLAPGSFAAALSAVGLSAQMVPEPPSPAWLGGALVVSLLLPRGRTTPPRKNTPN